eukprot:3941632-Rhodomonas_salina.2
MGTQLRKPLLWGEEVLATSETVIISAANDELAEKNILALLICKGTERYACALRLAKLPRIRIGGLPGYTGTGYTVLVPGTYYY